MRDLWHYRFYRKALVHGHERIYFEHFCNDFAAHSVPERDAAFMPKPTRTPAACVPASNTSTPSKRTPKSLQ
ncbi:MAG TPA: hypothetical protein VLM42_16305, partial [Bryobacteraceae bacterium]|nr:hypothetical protein [Bryobacteraceae bacterium]